MKSSKTSYVKGTEGVYVIDITLLANRIELLLTTTQRVASPPHPTKKQKTNKQSNTKWFRTY